MLISTLLSLSEMYGVLIRVLHGLLFMGVDVHTYIASRL